jgi:hypothetical protein
MKPGEVIEGQDGGRFEIVGGPIAYIGKEDCEDPRCRRRLGEPGCMGYHCPLCHEPCSMTGHRGCRGDGA